ncbi:MAG: TrkA family potassium uptake protein, partial [Clostridia bacterium]|nr:TrkA family potassium uptake protein [Clostridia bacterium]
MAIVKKEMSDFAVIGLGKFGSAIARELHELDKQVLVVDIDEDRVNAASEYATHAVIADASDEQAIQALGVNNFDAVIICMGKNMQASILTTLICKEQGASFVVAKASGRKHKEVLTKIGADLVVEPEEEMAQKMAVRLVTPHLNDIMVLDNYFTIAEAEVPEKWADRTLIDIDIRRKFGVTLLVIKNGDKVVSSPSGDTYLRAGDTIVIGGDNA